MIDFLLFSDIAKVQKKMEFQSVLNNRKWAKYGKNGENKKDANS